MTTDDAPTAPPSPVQPPDDQRCPTCGRGGAEGHTAAPWLDRLPMRDRLTDAFPKPPLDPTVLADVVCGRGGAPPCHCGKPVFVTECAFTRGLCEDCDAVRCDAYPGACRTKPPLDPTVLADAVQPGEDAE